MDTFLPHHLESSASLLTKTGLTRNADQESNWLYSLAIQDMESHISVLRWRKKKTKIAQIQMSLCLYQKLWQQPPDILTNKVQILE